MILNQNDRDVVILASSIRGGIRCEKTKERKCGYLIRPELWFRVMKEGSQRALESHGLVVRLTYTKPTEITKILGIINGLEDLSSTTEGLHGVRDLNGTLVQPRTHDDVLKALEIIESRVSIDNPHRIPTKPNSGDSDYE